MPRKRGLTDPVTDPSHNPPRGRDVLRTPLMGTVDSQAPSLARVDIGKNNRISAYGD